MIVLIGYHHFGLTVEEAQARNASREAEDVELAATSEKEGWQVKTGITGRKLAMEKADGFLSDKFGYWYVIDWKLGQGNLSFATVKANSSERHAFSLKLDKDGQYWGMLETVNQNPKSAWAINCRVMQSPELATPIDLPEELFERPRLLN